VLLRLQERRVAHSLISHGQQHVFKAWPKQGGQLKEAKLPYLPKLISADTVRSGVSAPSPLCMMITAIGSAQSAY
jgi:hypothetical protein